MSGGSFNYAFHHVYDFVEMLRQKISNSATPNEWGESRCLPPEVLAKLQAIAKDADRTANLMREAEWFFSVDTGEEDFLERVAEIDSGELVAR